MKSTKSILLKRSVPRPREKGVALVMAILILFVLTVLGLALLFSSTTELQLAGTETMVNKAFYAAESGLQYVYSQGRTAAYTGPGCTIGATTYTGFYCFDVSEQNTVDSTHSINVRVSPLRIVDYQIDHDEELNVGSVTLYYVTRHADSTATDTRSTLATMSKQVSADFIIGPVPLGPGDLN